MVLDRRHRLHGVGLADVLGARFRKPEMPDLAFRDQLLDRARHVLDWHVRVNAMLVEEVDGLDTQPLQRRVAHLADVLGPAIEPDNLALLVDLEASCSKSTRRLNRADNWRTNSDRFQSLLCVS
jgi:hypothetical protein